MSSENKPGLDSGAASLRSRIDKLSGINKQQVSLIRQGRSLRATIQSEARNDAGIGLDNPGRVDSYYFKDERLLVFDLSEYQPQTDD